MKAFEVRTPRSRASFGKWDLWPGSDRSDRLAQRRWRNFQKQLAMAPHLVAELLPSAGAAQRLSNYVGVGGLPYLAQRAAYDLFLQRCSTERRQVHSARSHSNQRP